MQKMIKEIASRLGLSVTITAAPISVAEVSRFLEQLRKQDPLFAKGVTSKDLFPSSLRFQGVIGLKLVAALSKLGWDVTEHQGYKGVGIWKLLREEEWPLTVEEKTNITLLTLASDDKVATGNDPEFVTQLKKLGKAILPSGSVISNGSASWYKKGGHAGGAVLVEILKRAVANGFSKGEYNPTGNADGSVMGGGSVYRKGPWILKTSSSYGSVASDNRFSATLSFDAQRGL